MEQPSKANEAVYKFYWAAAEANIAGLINTYQIEHFVSQNFEISHVKVMKVE